MKVDPDGTDWKCIVCDEWFENLISAQQHQDRPPHPVPALVLSVEELEGE